MKRGMDGLGLKEIHFQGTFEENIWGKLSCEIEAYRKKKKNFLNNISLKNFPTYCLFNEFNPQYNTNVHWTQCSFEFLFLSHYINKNLCFMAFILSKKSYKNQNNIYLFK